MSLEETKALIRRHEAALNSGRVEAGLELFADPCLFNGQPISREVIRQMRTILWTAAPDVRWIAEHLVAEGDWVAVRWTMRGTHTGEFVHPTWGSAPASGMPVVLHLPGPLPDRRRADRRGLGGARRPQPAGAVRSRRRAGAHRALTASQALSHICNRFQELVSKMAS